MHVVMPKFGPYSRVYVRRKFVPRWAVKPLFSLLRGGRQCLMCEPNWRLGLFFKSHLRYEGKHDLEWLAGR